MFFGFAIFGIMIILAVFLILFPAILTHQHVFVPLELEILFLVIVLFECVIADSLGFYAQFEYTMIPAITSFIGMLLVYVGYSLGKFRASYAMSWIMIVLITIGLGALLEGNRILL